MAGTDSAHLLRRYEEKDERKRILGGGAGSHANSPWLCQYRPGLWDYRCALCDTVEMGLMSLFVYAGSAQFAMLALIAVQAPVAAIAMTVFLINLRLFLLSLHASTYFRHTSLWQNIGMSSLLTDETYGVLMGELAHTDKVNPMWMHGNNLNSYVAWFVGTVVGTALGGLLPNPEIFGLDFALVGMFIGIFASQFQIMQRRIPVRNLLIILAVVAVSFFLLLTVVSQSLAVLFATLLGCSMGVVLDGQ